MRATIEEIKELDVESYISWLIQTVKDIEMATILIPITNERLNELCYNSYQWHSYEIQKITTDNTNYSHWYKKYEVLAGRKEDELKQKLKQLNDAMYQTCNLASQENCSKVIQEVQKNNNAKSLNFNSPFKICYMLCRYRAEI